MLQPGDHQYGHLEAQLHRGLGQHRQGAEHSGAGQSLELVELVLALTDLDEVPDHQAEGEEDGAEEDNPEGIFFKLLPPRTREISMEVGVGVAQRLYNVLSLLTFPACTKGRFILFRLEKSS